MNEGKETTAPSLLHRVDDDDRIQGVREAKAASIIVGEAVVKDEDAFLFDLLAADDVELTRVLRVGLILKRDVEEVAGFECERIHIGIAGGDEPWKLRSAADISFQDGPLDALGELDGSHGFAGLGAWRRIGRSEVREHVMELGRPVHEKYERREGELLGNLV